MQAGDARRWVPGRHRPAGFFRVAHNEYPGLTCSVIDHDGDWQSAEHVVAELLADDEADDVAWRAGVRYYAAHRGLHAAGSREGEPRQARRAARGRRTLRPGAHGSGLATSGDPQRDVLYWKQAMPASSPRMRLEIEVAYWQVRSEGGGRREQARRMQLTRPQWRECSGRISRVGAAVKGWRTGEPIAAAALLRPGVARHRARTGFASRQARCGARCVSVVNGHDRSLGRCGVAADGARAARDESVLVVSRRG